MVGTPNAATVAKPVREKSGDSLGALLDERLELVGTDELDGAIEERELGVLVIDDVIDDETNDEALDEATDDATEELDTPPAQMPAIALPLTLSESILAISCEPVARKRS